MLGLLLAVLATAFTVAMILLFERRRARQIERDLGRPEPGPEERPEEGPGR